MMQDNSFEKNMERELHDINMEPSPAVWLAVEKELDKKKRRYAIGWWWLFPILLAGVGLAGYFTYYGKSEKTLSKVPELNSKKVQPAAGTFKAAIADKNTVEQLPTSAVINKKQTKKSTTKLSYPSGYTVVSAGKLNTTADDFNPHKKTIQEKAGQNIMIIPANTSTAAETDTLVTEIALAETKQVDPQTTDVATSINAKEGIETEKQASAHLQISVPDSLPKPIGQKEENKKITKWKKEWSLAAGRSLFSAFDFSKAGDVFLSDAGTIGSSPGSAIRERTEYRFNSGMYIHAGMNIGRPVSKKITLFTGLHYNYQHIQLERRVNIDSLGLSGSPTYTYLRSSVYKEQLYIHSINIPLLLEFKLNKKLNISTGLYNNISLYSNWNKYKSILEDRRSYLPTWHLQPSYNFNHISIGPFLNIGLREYLVDQRLVNYGLQFKYALKK